MQNQTSLDSDLATYTNGQTPDPYTGVLSNLEVAKLAAQLEPVYTRTLVITSNFGGPNAFTIAPDYTQATVKDLGANLDASNSFSSPGATPTVNGLTPVLGANGQNLAPTRTPFNPTAPAAPFNVSADGVNNAAGTATLANVSGGPILVGTSPLDGSDRGNAMAIGNRNPGNSTTVQLTLQTTATTVTVNDAQTAAFSADNGPNSRVFFNPIAA